MKIPVMQFPVARGRERYEQLVRVASAARHMSEYGVRIDLARAQWHLDEAHKRAEAFTRKFLDLTGLSQADLGASGAGQTNAVRDWFWIRHNAPIVSRHRRTKAPQFNTATLVEYANDHAQTPFGPAAAALYGIRASRTAARFAEAYLRVGKRHDGRIKFGFNPIGTKGERWSASQKFAWWEEEDGPTGSWIQYSLNAQNVPSREPTFEFEKDVKTPVALSMRDIFIPDKGCVFWKSDYAGLEAELIGCLTGAKKLLHAFENNLDIHIENARLFFGENRVPPGAKKAKGDGPQARINSLRECAKPLMYGFSYQVRGDRGNDQYPEAYKQLKKSMPDTTPEGVQALARKFFDAYPEIGAFQQSIKKSIAKTGRVELALNGAFLYLPNEPRGWNQAVNFHMQSSGGFLINRAITNIAPRVAWHENCTSAPLLQVHDELAGQIQESRVEDFAQEVEAAMSEPAEFPHITKGIPCQVLVGPNWAQVSPRA